MNQLAHVLQLVGYYSVISYPYLTLYPHLLVAALFPIYAGAHASLSRPSSAAKPTKRSKKRDDDDDDDDVYEKEQAMEGLSPIDALLLPLFAGLLLASLYYLIIWLENPALLNKILNWYLATVGVWSLARTFVDSIGIVISVIFPKIHSMDDKNLETDARHGKSKPTSLPGMERKAAIIEPPSTFPANTSLRIKPALQTLQELLSQQLDVHVYIHKIVRARFKIGPQGILGFFLAMVTMLYFNLIGKPWWLTNLLGFSFAYSALQIMSPTTSWTGTLILSALFVYDIYFVFFTPLMVTVATQLDIPAKLLFPRPSRPTDDPSKQALSMLGLGDIIVPGMMIGFALRFDLYLFYLRKQTQRTTTNSSNTGNAAVGPASKETDDSEVIKATWHPATGGWGERFWTSKNDILRSKRFQGVIFPKTYFHASLTGYFLAMICTLIVVDIYGHAQPALLYLVPGVLTSLWGTALIKGNIKTLWAFDEFEDDQEKRNETPPSKTDKQDGSAWKKDSWMNVDWKSLFHSSPTNSHDSETSRKRPTTNDNHNASDPVDKHYSKRIKRSTPDDDDISPSPETSRKSSRSGSEKSPPVHSTDHAAKDSKNHSIDNDDDRRSSNKKSNSKKRRFFQRDRNSELVFISVNLRTTAAAKSYVDSAPPSDEEQVAHVADRTRAKTKTKEEGGRGVRRMVSEVGE